MHKVTVSTDWTSAGSQWIARILGPRGVAAARLFLFVFAVSFILGFCIVLFISPKYSAMAIVGPQVQEQTGSLSAGLGSMNLGSLTSFLGGQQQSEELVAFQSLLGTASFAEYLIKNDHLDKVVFPNGIHHSLVSTLLHKLLGQDVSNTVTAADLQYYIQSHISIQSRLETPYIELIYANQKRADAIGVLQTVMYSGDKVLRVRKARSIDREIEYLSSVLKTTTDVERLDLFRKMLGEKLAAKVLIDTEDTYAFRVFDAPFAPLVPNSPNIAMLMAVLVLTALFLAMTAVVGKSWYRQDRSRSEQ